MPSAPISEMIFMTLAIETHQLTRFFNDFCAVKGIELAVERGTFYGFLGPNGAGKSTTIKMLTGLARPVRRRRCSCWGGTCSTRARRSRPSAAWGSFRKTWRCSTT